MKSLLLNARGAGLLMVLLVLNAQLSTSLAQGTAFTYQGRLNSGGGAATGTYDFRFRLAADPLANNYVGGNVFTNGVPINSGLFTVALDFGAGIFNGSNYWLEIAVRTNGIGGYTTLAPLQQLTPTPYAVYATTASNVVGVLPNSGLSGSYSSPVAFNNSGNIFSGSYNGNGGGLTNINAATLGGLPGSGFWKTAGNTGTSPTNGNFLGTMDNQPLQIAVNGQRAMRFEPVADAPNIIGGNSNNAVAPGVQAAVIAGGGQTPYPNTVLADFATIGGGTFHTVAGPWGTVGGGRDSSVYAESATVAGGYANSAGTNAYAAFIGGGNGNIIDSGYAAVGGGAGNLVRTNAGWTFIGGGNGNVIDVDSYFAGVTGGQANMIGTNTPWAFIGGGYGNVISNRQTSFSQGGFIGGGAYNALYGHWGGIGAGWGNTIESNVNMAFIGGGFGNYVGTGYSFLGGGNGNAAQPFAQFSVLGGGQTNAILSGADHSFLGGGGANTNAGQYSSIPGGNLNYAGGQYSLAAGHQAKAMNAGTFVWADSTAADFSSTASNQFLVRATGGVGINTTNPVSTLDVNGSVNVSGNASIAGALKLGSGTGTDYSPSYPLVIRRVNSLSPTSSNFVARTDTCFIQRDGSNGGLRFGWISSPGNVMCSATGVTGTGAVIGFYNFQPSPATAGSVQIFTDAQDVKSVRISFGNPYSNIQMTELNVSRYATDYFWVGTLASSYNQ